MKNFIVGAVIGLILIVIGVGMLAGKIEVPRQNISDIATTTTSTAKQTITISEQKIDEQKDGVIFSIIFPQILN